MAETQEATAQLIDEHAWERADVLPLGDPLPLAEWLEGVRHLLVMTVHPIYRREVMASASRLLAGRYGPLVLVWGGRST